MLQKIHLHLHLADAFIQSDLQCIQAIHFLSDTISWYFLSNTKKDNLEATAKREERVHLKRNKFSPVKCTSPLQCQTSPKMERSLPGDQEVGPVELQGSGGGHWGRCPHCPRVQFKTLFSHCRRNRHQRKTETS